MAHTTRRMLLNAAICGGVGRALQTPAEEIEGAEPGRRELYGLLGDLPPRQRPIGARTLSIEERPGFVLEKLVLDINGFEPAPAWFVKPKHLEGKAPAILFYHWHAGEYKLGKDELLRPKPGNVPSYAEDLTAQGYCALCLDMWCFGERSVRTELDVQGNALEGPGAVGHDGLRHSARPRLPGHTSGSGHHANRHPGNVHGQYDGLVGGSPRSAQSVVDHH